MSAIFLLDTGVMGIWASCCIWANKADITSCTSVATDIKSLENDFSGSGRNINKDSQTFWRHRTDRHTKSIYWYLLLTQFHYELFMNESNKCILSFETEDRWMDTCWTWADKSLMSAKRSSSVSVELKTSVSFWRRSWWRSKPSSIRLKLSAWSKQSSSSSNTLQPDSIALVNAFIPHIYQTMILWDRLEHWSCRDPHVT